MSNRVIHVQLTEASIDKAIEELKNYKQWLKKCTEKFVYELGKQGLEISRIKFQNATYDGVNDVSVKLNKIGKKKVAVVAIGASVLFIEFGTGVTYPDNHPEAGQLGMIRGSYGKGHGKQSAWGYYGEPGTNGVIKKETDKGTLVITRGNPANMPMYETVKELKDKIEEIARGCYV